MHYRPGSCGKLCQDPRVNHHAECCADELEQQLAVGLIAMFTDNQGGFLAASAVVVVAAKNQPGVESTLVWYST